METKAAPIRSPFISSLEFKIENDKKICGDKSNQVSWKVFSSNDENYKPGSVSFCKKLSVVPYGILESILSVPYHLFIVTIVAPRSNNLNLVNWGWKIAFILAYDIKQGLGYLILPIYEKRGLSWIAQSNLEKNRLFYMYDSRTKDKFLGNLLNEFLEISQVNLEVNYNEQISNLIDILWQDSDAFLAVLKYVKRENFEKFAKIDANTKIEGLTFQIAITYLTLLCQEIEYKGPFSFNEEYVSWSIVNNTLFKVEELEKLHITEVEKISKVKSLSVQKMVEYLKKKMEVGLEESKNENDSNTNNKIRQVENHLKKVVAEHKVQENLLSPVLELFKNFPCTYLSIRSRYYKSNFEKSERPQQMQNLLEQYIPYLIENKIKIDSIDDMFYKIEITDSDKLEEYKNTLRNL